MPDSAEPTHQTKIPQGSVKFIKTLDLHDQSNFSTRNHSLLTRDSLDMSVSS